MSQATLSKTVTEEFIEELDVLIDDDKFTWAFDWLCDVREAVSQGATVTITMRAALENIRNGRRRLTPYSAGGDSRDGGMRLPSERFNGSRRYEGAEK